MCMVQGIAGSATSALLCSWLSPEAAPVLAAWLTVITDRISLQPSWLLYHVLAMMGTAAGAVAASLFL